MEKVKVTKEQITTRDVYVREIANVANNRFLTDAERSVKIAELQRILNKQNNS